MATKALATKKAMTPRPAPTGAELRELIRATVAEYFPLCEDVSLLLIPGPVGACGGPSGRLTSPSNLS